MGRPTTQRDPKDLAARSRDRPRGHPGQVCAAKLSKAVFRGQGTWFLALGRLEVAGFEIGDDL